MPSANSLDYCFLSHISKDVCPHFPPLFFLLFSQNSTDKFLWIIHILASIAIANHCFPSQFPYPFQCLEAKVELSSLVWRYHSLPSHCLWDYTHWGLILGLLTLNKLLNFTESPFVHFLKLDRLIFKPTASLVFGFCHPCLHLISFLALLPHQQVSLYLIAIAVLSLISTWHKLESFEKGELHLWDCPSGLVCGQVCGLFS